MLHESKQHKDFGIQTKNNGKQITLCLNIMSEPGILARFKLVFLQSAVLPAVLERTQSGRGFLLEEGRRGLLCFLQLKQKVSECMIEPYSIYIFAFLSTSPTEMGSMRKGILFT